ncbi:MAG: hypothetical protein RLZZ543_1773 [Bacteroidota bacterium]|jgi:hypothetical protein
MYSGMFNAKRLPYLFLLLFLLGNTVLSAQNASIAGRVTGEQGNILAGVAIFRLGDMGNAVTSDSEGRFKLNLPAEQQIYLVFYLTGFESDTMAFRLKPNENRVIDRYLSKKIKDISTFEVVSKTDREIGLQRLDPLIVNSLTGPGDAISMALKTLPGVTSNNELSSQYSVRGGNYDENLVYVNDVEIYRPFLVRAGQQEGLSFANPAMVENLRFSAGGFEAKYGDKMSSVLDITYKRPKSFGGSASASILGGNLQLEGATKNYRLSGMIGARYRTTQYLLNSLDVQGQYRPSFTDVQGYVLYNITEKWDIDFLGNYAVNNYRVFPQNQTTEFGTINQALQLKVYFDGKDQSRFATSMGAMTSTWRPNRKTKLKLIASIFNSSETEKSDVAGEYYINELERDLGSSDFGDVAFNRGIGAYQTFIRNALHYTVANVEHKGYVEKGDHYFQWGARAQNEQIQDQIKEWRMIDSAGYSMPLLPVDQIVLESNLKSSASLNSMRYQGYVQDNYHWRKTYGKDSVDFSLTGGIRANHWTINGQTTVSPRLVFSFSPLSWKRDVTFRMASGHYAQPPFYRELRGFDGTLNKALKAQESWHFITGADFTFKAWGRPFNMYAEAYYKILRNLVPYEVDNVRVRYFANNSSDGYAQGIDMKVNGEFVKGVQSWASLSFLKTREDIRDDFYYVRYNSDGEKIVPGLTNNNIAVDSQRVEPGYIPRPTDQRFNFSLFFQDYLPKNESISMQITLVLGGKLPTGPPDHERYRDTLRVPSYRRVDIGVSKQFIRAGKPLPKTSPLHSLKTLTLSLEVFNLLGVNNTVSYIWIKDVTNRTYGIPNYLTNRLLNVRLQASF